MNWWAARRKVVNWLAARCSQRVERLKLGRTAPKTGGCLSESIARIGMKVVTVGDGDLWFAWDETGRSSTGWNCLDWIYFAQEYAREMWAT